VADPGFDLRGERGLCQRGVGGLLFLLKLGLKCIGSEAIEKKSLGQKRGRPLDLLEAIMLILCF